MDLMDLLAKAGGGKSLDQLAGSVGLGSSQTKDLIGALAPALMTGLKKQTESGTTLQGLQKALAGGQHQKYLEQPELMQSEATRDDGNKILGHIFGSKDVSRNVAAEAAQQTGIDAGVIKKALPLLAGLAMGALSKNSKDADSAGGLGGLLGGLLGGGNSTSSIGNLLGMAKKLF